MALKEHGISCPDKVLSNDKRENGKPAVHTPWAHQPGHSAAKHHGAWAYRSSVWEATEGYSGSHAFDYAYWSAMLRTGATVGNPLDTHPHSYLYRWQTSGYPNGSGYGKDFYERVLASHAPADGVWPIEPAMDDETREYYALYGEHT